MERVLFISYIEKRYIELRVQHLLEADVWLVYSWRRNIILTKVFEYLRAKKPILALAGKRDALANLEEQG
jgi:hypothetical protein